MIYFGQNRLKLSTQSSLLNYALSMVEIPYKRKNKMAKEEEKKELTREELEARREALRERMSDLRGVTVTNPSDEADSEEKSEEERYSEGFRARMSDVRGFRIIKAEDVKKNNSEL
jgi:hypothetical protein